MSPAQYNEVGLHQRFKTLLRVMGNGRWGGMGAVCVMCATVDSISSNEVVHGNYWNVILYSIVDTLRTTTFNVQELHILSRSVFKHPAWLFQQSAVISLLNK